MALLIAAIAFVFLLGVLILVHELGHLTVAKLAGVTVEEFGIGFPPNAKQWKRGETTYSLNWLPFGGYVRMLGQDDFHPDKVSSDPRSYDRAHPLWKIAIAIAGVFMNFVLAILILWGGYMVGMSPILRGEQQVVVATVEEGSPAALAGFLPEDILQGVNGTPVLSVESFADAVSYTPGSPLSVSVLRGTETQTLTVVPREDGRIGVAIGLFDHHAFVQVGPATAFVYALEDPGNVTVMTFKGLGNLVTGIFTRFELTDEVGGPVRIAEVTYQAVQLGWGMFFQLMALLSLSLAVLNIIPFPALDGGHILFTVIEFVARKPLPIKVKTVIQATGMSLLLALIAATVVNDILRLINTP